MNEINTNFNELKVGDIVTAYYRDYCRIIKITERIDSRDRIQNPLISLQPLLDYEGKLCNHLSPYECDASWCHLIDRQFIKNKIADYSNKLYNILDTLETLQNQELFSKINLSLDDIKDELEFNKIWIENNEIVLQLYVPFDYDIKQLPFIEHPQLTHFGKRYYYLHHCAINIHFKLGE